MSLAFYWIHLKLLTIHNDPLHSFTLQNHEVVIQIFESSDHEWCHMYPAECLIYIPISKNIYKLVKINFNIK